MRLLLDTNILIPLVDGGGRELPAGTLEALRDEDTILWASVVSIWEVAIKHRLGKLPLPIPLRDWPAALKTLNVTAMTIRTAHVIQAVQPRPEVNDPFDYLLLGICQAEQMQLLTLDDRLRGHPLAWRPSA